MTPILFLMAYALGLVGTFWRPQIGVYMYVTIYFLNPLDRWWGASIPSLRYGFMIAIAVLISFVLHGYMSRLKEILLHPVMFVWGMLVGWHYLVTLWALNGPLHAYFSLQMLTVYVIGTVAACVLDTVERLKILLTVFVFGAFYIGYLGYKQGAQWRRASRGHRDGRRARFQRLRGHDRGHLPDSLLHGVIRESRAKGHCSFGDAVHPERAGPHQQPRRVLGSCGRQQLPNLDHHAKP